MAWSSKVFSVAYITDILNGTANMTLLSDNLKVALFDNSVTPNQTGVSSATAYGAAPWNAGGVFDAAGWPAVGRQLLSVTSTAGGTNVYALDAADTVSANGTTTLTNAYGCLIYDDTVTTPVADQGICFNSFGGAASVPSGTFTVVWPAGGFMTITA